MDARTLSMDEYKKRLQEELLDLEEDFEIFNKEKDYSLGK